MLLLLRELSIGLPYYFVADAYYVSRRVIKGLLDSGNHLVSRVRSNAVRKLGAYHAPIQVGVIAQGMLQYLSATASTAVWKNFGSWIRTIRPGILPSEQVAASALKNSLPNFLEVSGETQILAKFIADRFDLSQAEGIRLAG